MIVLTKQVSAQSVPTIISHHGRLLNASSQPVTSAVSVEFKIYGVLSGGTHVWSETQSITPDNLGFYDTYLGGVQPLPVTLPNPSYLEIVVNTETLSPRLQFGAVPFAMTAGNGGKIVNVTVRENSSRFSIGVSPSITLESFTIDKKSPTSFLLIQGTISGKGRFSSNLTQGWKYGSGTEITAQSMDRPEDMDASVVIPTTAVISGHSTTGSQTMVFRYFSQDGSAGDKPFVVYNPNSIDDPRLGQTKSIYTVWEIEP